jgi:hypothetical protein
MLAAADGSLLERHLSEVVAEHVRATARHTVSGAERRSWDRSLPVLAADLLDAGLDDLEMLIEYQLPLTSKRADVVLAGVDRRTGEDSYLVVELKQWSHAEAFEDDERLVLVDGIPGGPRLHPLVQVQQYCDYLTDYVATLEGHPESVGGLAYLHNAADRDVADLRTHAGESRMRLFTRSRRAEFLDYLRDRFSPAVGAAAADRLEASRIRPSKQLMALAAEEVKNREQFVLLDEQMVAFELVRHTAEHARRSDTKEVIVVTGGPGSGKSAIALSLLGEFSRQGRPVVHATGSKSFTETMRKVVGKGSTRTKSLFKYFNNFMAAERNDLEVIICDEAHRIREKSTGRFTPKALRSDRPQIDELIAAARVPVFLLDEHQVVRPGEIGSVADIKRHAASMGLTVRQVDLDAQFRCGGSRTYEEWVHRLLGLAGDKAEPWTGDERFEVRLAGSPAEMEQFLREKLAAGYGARITAGFCWPWSDPRDDDTLVPDVRIGAWARPWNVKSEQNRSVGDAPPSVLWSTAEGGFEQVGCIYTAQGFEYDWAGVIIGPDLVARDGRLITMRSESRDPELRKRSVDGRQADRLIRNAYKVLLTRGMMGTLIFSVDEETQEFLGELLRPAGR